jgi:hypothetical protein
VQEEALGQLALQPHHDVHALPGIGSREEQQEFLGAEAGDDVRRPHRLLDHGGEWASASSPA